MTGLLAGKRVLVVEDEYFIASDLRRQLAREGAEIVGPVGNLAAGLTLAEQPLDAAVLDVNLADTMSYPIADCLKAREVPFLFLTGYDGWSLPDTHRDAPRMAKPYAAGSVVRMVSDLIAAVPATVR